MPGDEVLYRVEARRFVAGLIARDGRVVRAAPILRWSVGRPLDEVRREVEERGETMALVNPERR